MTNDDLTVTISGSPRSESYDLARRVAFDLATKGYRIGRVRHWDPAVERSIRAGVASAQEWNEGRDVDLSARPVVHVVVEDSPKDNLGRALDLFMQGHTNRLEAAVTEAKGALNRVQAVIEMADVERDTLVRNHRKVFHENRLSEKGRYRDGTPIQDTALSDAMGYPGEYREGDMDAFFTPTGGDQ